MDVENQNIAGAAEDASSPENQAAAAVATPAEDNSAVIRETVAETLAALGLTGEAARRGSPEVDKLAAALSRLSDEVRARTESILSTLLDRLEDPRGVIAFNRQKRLFLDLLTLHDLMRDLERGVAENSGNESSNYRHLRDQLLQLLAMNNVMPIACQAGTPCNYQQNMAVRALATEDPALDNIIETVVRDGFVFGAYVVRPTQVVVWKRAAPADGSM